LSIGSYAPMPAADDLMAYVRKMDDRRLLVVLNFSAQARRFNIDDMQARAALLLSTDLDREREELREQVLLRGNEGVIIELQ
jgi:hypothetical protein